MYTNDISIIKRLDRRDILKSVGASSTLATAIGSATARESTDLNELHLNLDEARKKATVENAKHVFSTVGRGLLNALRDTGFIKAATFEALDIEIVKIHEGKLSNNSIVVYSGVYDDDHEIVYKTQISNARFDSPILVTVREFSEKAGATANLNGEFYALTEEYGEFIHISNRPRTVDCGCTGAPECCNECKCPEETYEAKETCSDGTEYHCGTCRLECSPCETSWPC